MNSLQETSPPRTPLKTRLPLDAREFLMALSPQKPFLIENAKTFLGTFHTSATNLLEKMKQKYLLELKSRSFIDCGLEFRLESFKERLKEAEKLIQEKVDLRLGVEILTIALNWMHPFHFRLEDGKLSILYQEGFELVVKGYELLALGAYRQENYRVCERAAKISLGMRPNNVPMMRLLFSTYSQDGQLEKAKKVLESAKRLLSNKDFMAISGELQQKQKRRRRISPWSYLTNRRYLTAFFGTTAFTFIFSRFFIKWQTTYSLIYSLGITFISVLATLLSNYLKSN